MMHPTLAVGLALLTWLLVHRRSAATRVLLGGSAFLLGWEPASAGSGAGLFLLVVAVGVALSLAWDGWARTRARTASVHGMSPPSEMPRTQNEPAPASDEPMTELDRAESYGELLDAYFAGLQEAQESGDVRAQAAFAGEIADIAQEMRVLLRVVVGERQRLAN